MSGLSSRTGMNIKETPATAEKPSDADEWWGSDSDAGNAKADARV